MGARVIARPRRRQAGGRGSRRGRGDDRQRRGGLEERLKALGGVDVVYDAVGEPMATAALRATKPGGRFPVIGFAAGEVPVFKANYLLVKNITVHGLYWGGYLTFDPAVLTGSLTRLFGWYADGGLRPHVSHVLPPDRALRGWSCRRPAPRPARW